MKKKVAKKQSYYGTVRAVATSRLRWRRRMGLAYRVGAEQLKRSLRVGRADGVGCGWLFGLVLDGTVAGGNRSGTGGEGSEGPRLTFCEMFSFRATEAKSTCASPPGALCLVYRSAT